MITMLLLGVSELLHERLRVALADASLFVAESEEDAIHQLRHVDVDIVIWAAVARPRVSDEFSATVRDVSPSCVTIAVGDEGGAVADFTLQAGHSGRQLSDVLNRALERRGMLQELKDLRARVAAVQQKPVQSFESTLPSATSDPARILREFTRIIAAGFDLPLMLDTFVAGVIELVRPTRLALLLPEADRRTYRVNVSRGIELRVAASIRLPRDRGLCRWLAVEGRPAHRDIGDSHLRRELDLLHGIIAIPLMAHGQLVAILIVGQPLVRDEYSARELETLFELGGHLATAINDVTIHHRLQRAGELNKRILEHLSSGVITIGSDQVIGTVNRRAAEILNLPVASLVGQDLRLLPSPLGDMLYETLATTKALARTEIRLAAHGLWLEVSTYPVSDQDAAGAVLVVEDVTVQKELAVQRLRAEQFDLLTRLVARIADEIKNPLVSINTFIELVGERYDNPDFRQQFSEVVRRDVRRLVQAFERLSTLVSMGELNFRTVDMSSVIDEAVAAVKLGEDVAQLPIEVQVIREPTTLEVKADRDQLRRALCYLIWYLGSRSSERAGVSVSVGRRSGHAGSDDVRVTLSSRVAVPARELDSLFDPVRVIQENLIDIGPAVSQRIVEALGGHLTLRQNRQDLAFTMQLPAST